MGKDEIAHGWIAFPVLPQGFLFLCPTRVPSNDTKIIFFFTFIDSLDLLLIIVLLVLIRRIKALEKEI